MKQFCKRSLAAILLLVVLVGCFSGITIRASAASYVYNWGTREDVADEADFTRSTAEEWYAKYNTSYEELSQYAGSSNNSSVPSSRLYQELRSLMRGAVSNTTSYEAIKTLCQYTDCQNGGGKISSFYSGTAIGPGWNKDEWNREHTWPNSKGDANGGGENDIFMLRPTSIQENSSRGNDAYGESSGYYNPNSESGGKHDLRGDVARIILFVYVRWQDTSNSKAVLFGSSGVIENKTVMLKWMEEDPVDTWELGRNDSCQSITGTRNVFVDYPELGFLLFGAEVPSDYQSPSGSAISSYKITATSNNTSYGTVSLSGKTITAKPATGYYASGYTVTSGSATVTQNGNTFTVNASSNCTVRINFAKKASYTVTYMADGSKYTSKEAYGGDIISVSSYTGTVPEGYTFKGWVTATVSDTTSKPATIYVAGDSYTVTANTTLHALFSYSEGGSGKTEYVLTELADIGANDTTVITVTTSSGTVYAMTNNNGTSKAPTGDTTVRVSSDGKTLISEPADYLKWNVGGSAGAYIFYPEGNTSVWLYCTSTNNGVRVGTTEDNTFKIDSSSGYLYHNGTKRYIGVYTTNPDWRCYTSSGGNIANQTLGFYVLREVGTTYYTTNITQCNHTNVVVDAAVVATCQTTGLTAGSHCGDCGQVLVVQTVINTVACDYRPIVTPPTCTELGYSTYTCIWCGEVDEETDYVDALGHSYNDNGVCGVCGANKILLAGWNLVLTDCIGVNFHLNLTAEEAAKTQVRFTVNGAASTVDAASAQIKDGRYVFSLELAAAQMTEKITVEILLDGSIAQTGEYSVRQYAETVLNDREGEFTDATKTLVKAMLNYGAEAQRYFRCNTNNLADAGYVQESFTAVPVYAAKYPVSGSVSGASYYGASLLFHSNVAVRFYFTGDVSGLTFTASGKTLTPVKKGDLYYVQITDILPQDMDKAVVLTVSDGASTMSVSYSPMDYMVNQYAGGTDGLKALLLKLYNYYLAAKAYTD